MSEKVLVCPECKSNKHFDYPRRDVTVCVGCGIMFHNKDLQETKK